MSNLVAYYEDEPVVVKGKVEIAQRPVPHQAMPVSEGALRPGVVYVLVASSVGPPLHVPFATYDEWSLRDRYNEALRILNTLGASRIDCSTFGETKSSWRAGLKIVGKGSAGARKSKVVGSGFDYTHTGTGSQARDPRPLRWPDEPGFAAAIEGVLANKATHVSINIHASTRYAASSDLGKALGRLGFELGVESQNSKISTLRIEADFPARKWGL